MRMRPLPSYSLLALFLLGAAVSAAAQQWYSACAVSPTAQTWQIVPGKNMSCAAWGFFSDEIESTGWGRLLVESSYKCPDAQQAAAAGFLEGFLTAPRIAQGYTNSMQMVFNSTGPIPPKVANFFQSQMEWLEDGVADNPQSPWWNHASLLMQQLSGLWAGYQASEQQPALSLLDFWFINSVEETFDIISAVMPTARPDFAQMSNAQLAAYLARNGHCSVLIKVADDLSDLWMAHTNWASYSTMLRAIKQYRLYFTAVQTVGSTVTMSSYYGALSSIDDFYVTSAGLCVTETTNDILNPALYALIRPQSAPVWLRAMVASRLAADGASWMQAFGQANSGTYNNQWMVLDTKRFTVGRPMQAGTLTVGEQMPGRFESGDRTHHLAMAGFWSSFNRPYFPDQFIDMGYAAYEARSNVFSFDNNPRVAIFRREQSSVHSVETMQRLIALNRWQTDPLSQGNAGNQIAARFDLTTPGPQPIDWLERGPHGGTDGKVVSLANIQAQTLWARCGPTHDDQPPFVWSSSEWNNTCSHVGQPDRFAFDWQLFDFSAY